MKKDALKRAQAAVAQAAVTGRRPSAGKRREPSRAEAGAQRRCGENTVKLGLGLL